MDRLKKETEEVERIFERAKLEALAVLTSIKPEIQEIPTDTPQNLANVTEAAKYLGISESQLRALERRGEVPAYRPGGILRFDLRELKESVRSKKPNLRAVS
jgi:excisionase family DNA binding protein